MTENVPEEIKRKGDHYRSRVEQHADAAELDELWADVLQSARFMLSRHGLPDEEVDVVGRSLAAPVTDDARRAAIEGGGLKVKYPYLA